MPAARRTLLGDGPPRAGFLRAGHYASARDRAASFHARGPSRLGFPFLAEHEVRAGGALHPDVCNPRGSARVKSKQLRDSLSGATDAPDHAQTEDAEAVRLGEVATQQLKDFIMTAFVKAPPPLTDLKFEQMTRRQKVVFIMKVTACIATFGFAFPTVSSD